MKESSIRVAIFRPDQPVTFEWIANELEPMQKLVGGYIETLAISDRLTAILNEEGKLESLPVNRVILGPGGVDHLVGTFFVVRSAEAEFTSIWVSDEEQLRQWGPYGTWALRYGGEE